MAIHVYRIGVHLAMQGNAAVGVAALAGQMLGLQRNIDAANRGFNRLSVAIAGAGAAFAGAGLLRGMGALVEAGKELVHQQTLLRAAGESQQSVAQATATAWRTTGQVMGTTASGNLRALGDLRGLIGSLPEAQQVLGDFQRASRVLGIVTGQGDERAAGQMARFLDLRGALRFDEQGNLDRARLDAEMNQFLRAIITNRGRVGPEQLLNFIQQARTAGIALSPTAMYADASTLIESMGGHRAGTGLAAVWRQFGTGTMTQRVAEFLMQGGVLAQNTQLGGRMRDPRTGRWRVAPAGEVIVGEGGIPELQMLAQDPSQWLQRHFFPRAAEWATRQGATPMTGDERQEQLNQLASQGVDTGLLSRLTEHDLRVLQFIRRGSGTETAAGTISQFYLSRQQIERERRMQAGVSPTAAQDLIEQSPVAAWQNLRAAWTNLMTAMGSPMVSTAARLMNALARGLNAFAQVIERHPDAARVIGIMLAGLGAALVVIGGLAVAGAAIMVIGAPLAQAIIGTGLALGALYVAITQINWHGVAEFFRVWGTTLWGVIRGAAVWVATQITGWDWLAPWRWLGERLTEARELLRGVLDSIVAWITGWIPGFQAAVESIRSLNIGQMIADWLRGIPGQIMQSLQGTGQGALSNPEAQEQRRGNWGGRGAAGGYYGGPAEEPVAPPSEMGDPRGGEDNVSPGPRHEGSRFVPGPTLASAGVLEAAVYFDRERVGTALLPAIGRAASGPIQGTARTDRRRMQPSPAATFATA
jgi:hypothetical protein